MNPLGCVGSNPNHDDATVIELSFHSYKAANKGTVSYPPFDTVLERAATIAANEDTYLTHESINVSTTECFFSVTSTGVVFLMKFMFSNPII